LLTVFAVWVALLLAGWALIFASADAVVLDSRTQQPAGAVGLLYFVAYSVFTLGNGDYAPQGEPWQLATAAMAGSGLFLITLAITYLLPVLSAVVDKRALASQISALGSNPAQIVITAWDGHGFAGFALQLVVLTSMLGRLAEQHLAYPVLHFFHTPDRQKASAPAIASLDEALTVMQLAVPAQHRLAPVVLQPARRAIASYLETVASPMLGSADRTPPPPDLTEVSHARIPTLAYDEFTAALDGLADRRRQLATLVLNGGWTWEEL
jgi:hypothetical protein